ncbi:hypothetical protein KCU95_g10545, partial [Aureobasidium melanogenum]
MPPIQGWFKAKKPLQASRKKYYEDIFGEKNPEEDLESVHIIDTESDSGPEFFSRRARRQAQKKPRITLRLSNKDRSDGGNKMGTADGNEVVALRVDRSTVVTIDDDDSDVGESFVADLRKHAQGPDNKNDKDDIEGLKSNQKEIDAAFLAEVKKYAAQPSSINSESNDELLERIHRRAESFANQSPLGPRQGLELEPTVLPSIEQANGRSARAESDEPADRPSVKVLDDAMSTGVVDGVVASDTSRPSITAVRDHSWDPSQGSDYVYSDEEALDGLENMNPPYEEHLVDGVQREMGNGTAEVVSTHGSSPVDNDNQEVIDLTSPTQSSSEEPALRRTGFSRRSTHGFRDHDPSTSLEPVAALARTRKRRFGLFASDPRLSLEPDLGELSDDSPPRRLRDLVQERRRDKEQASARKRARYNLRPRRQQESYTASRFEGRISMADEVASETEERPRPRRITRSMTSKEESAKKPIPRFKAARKSAWPLVPKDDTSSSRRESARPVVEIVVPKIVDRATWGVSPSARSSPQPKRRQSPASNGGPVTKDGEQKMEPALAGKGIKRMTPILID